MTTAEYERLAMRTEADQGVILERLVKLGPNAMRLDNGARGLCNDAGEVSSAVMKYIEYGRELDRTNLVEEVGDCLWRLAQVAKAGGFTLEEAMVANIAKLTVRYPEKYSEHHSENRDRGAEAKAVSEAVLIEKKYGPKETVEGFNILSSVYMLDGKVCEVCKQPATSARHDSDREFTREEHHYFCKAHDRPTALLPTLRKS